MSGAIEVWRGCVNTWECDEMGHMNVRFYVAKWRLALAYFAALAGLGSAFKSRGASTLLPVDQHIRFHAEARPGAPLSLRAGVLSLDACDMVLAAEMLHADGSSAATFVTRVTHVDAREGRAFPWSSKARERLAAMMTSLPKAAAPRSIDTEIAPGAVNRAAAIELGLPIIGQTVIGPEDLDTFGRMHAEHVIGRISDSAVNLEEASWRMLAKKAEPDAAIGGAAVEYRLVYRRWPQAGDLIEVRAGLVRAADKVQTFVYWLLDPISGEAWASAQSIVLAFDLSTRRAIPLPAAVRRAMEKRAFSDLYI